MKKNHGFTLLELLIVVAIIGLLTTVVLFIINDTRKKGNDAERISNLRQVQNALELYFTDNQGYPTHIYPDGGTPSPLVAGGYISEVSLDPSGAKYEYAALRSCRGYHLAALLEKTDNDVLDSDADYVGGTNYTVADLCDSSDSVIDGTDPVYDIVR